MKKYFLAIMLVTVVTAISYSQQNQKPKWLSQKGYWMIESNVKSPKSSVIYFFNNDNVMVYKENVGGLRVKINKTKVKMSLKKILEQSVIAWEQKHVTRENDYLVATALRK